MFVIGTAGHVDHGKSTLVHALTGMDPDRLREEKERGLTITLGFAWLRLPSGRDVSIVDVPGHERFIKNMLAGAGGVDVAMLVVAADEGPMPQTREHLAILDLLDVPRALTVITRCDLAEPGYVDLVEAELSEILDGTRFRGAPVVRVSGVTGEGLPELVETIDGLLETTPGKRDIRRPRLPVDRAFTVQGFGTVVTGTLLDGAFEVGQEVELQPGAIRGRIRGLQRHKEKVSRLEPGTRAAVNLSGIHTEDLERGMVVAGVGALRPVNALDVRLRATSLLPHPVRHNAGVTFLCATAERQGILRLLDRDELLPGDESWAQVVLDEPVAVLPGDHCVLRTTNDTIGGGPVITAGAPRHRRRHEPTLERLRVRAEGSLADRALEVLAAGPLSLSVLAERLGTPPDTLSTNLDALRATGAILDRRNLLVAGTWAESSIDRVLAAARDYLAANPLRDHVPREHARSVSGMTPELFDLVVEAGVERGRIEVRGANGISPPGQQVELPPDVRAQAESFLADLRAGGFSPPTDNQPGPELLAYLVQQGDVVSTAGGVVFDAATYQEMVDRVVTHIREYGSVSLAETRDIFGTSRKYAQAFLEHLDDQRITRRTGDARVLRGS